MSERCFACGGQFTPVESGAVHDYMLSTPGCWAAFGEVLTREYSDPELFASSHRLSVDAYAIQHPGRADDRRAVQSVWLHATSVWMVFEQGVDFAEATRALKRLVGQTPPERPSAPERFSLTHEAVLAGPVEDHARLVRDWARAALDEWSDLSVEIERMATKVRE